MRRLVTLAIVLLLLVALPGIGWADDGDQPTGGDESTGGNEQPANPPGRQRPEYIPSDPAEVRVWPNTFGYGSQFTLVGANFRPGEAISLSITCGSQSSEFPPAEADASGAVHMVVSDLGMPDLVHITSQCTATMTGARTGRTDNVKFTVGPSPGTISNVVRTADDTYSIALGYTLAPNEEVNIALEDGGLWRIDSCTTRADKDGKVTGEIDLLWSYWSVRIPGCAPSEPFDITDGLWAFRYQGKSGKAGIAYFEIY